MNNLLTKLYYGQIDIANKKPNKKRSNKERPSENLTVFLYLVSLCILREMPRKGRRPLLASIFFSVVSMILFHFAAEIVSLRGFIKLLMGSVLIPCFSMSLA